MKKILFVAWLGLLLLPACQQESKKTNEEEPSEAIEESEVEEVPTYSELDMDEAMEAFRDGDKAAAANYIQSSATDLREEGAELTGNDKVLLDMSIANLDNLAVQVKAGKVEDAAALNKIFAAAEMNVAHAYFIFSEVYAPASPEKATNRLEKAIIKMEHATAKLEGEAKTEADAILAESRAFLKKEDKKTEDWGNATGRQINKMGAWLKKNVNN